MRGSLDSEMVAGISASFSSQLNHLEQQKIIVGSQVSHENQQQQQQQQQQQLCEHTHTTTTSSSSSIIYYNKEKELVAIHSCIAGTENKNCMKLFY